MGSFVGFSRSFVTERGRRVEWDPTIGETELARYAVDSKLVEFKIPIYARKIRIQFLALRSRFYDINSIRI